MLFLLYHLYSSRPAFVRADPAALAIIQICLKKSVFALLYASFRAKYVADAALDALIVVPDGPL
jgi:hypothetical protein